MVACHSIYAWHDMGNLRTVGQSTCAVLLLSHIVLCSVVQGTVALLESGGKLQLVGGSHS